MTAHVIASSSTHGSVSSGAPTFVANHTFKVGRKIGEGSFGVVFEGTTVANGTPVAIKFEPRKSDAPQLRDEYRSYRTLSGTPGVPQVYHFGVEGLHNVLVMDLFGPNLEDLFDMCGRKYTLKTVCMLAKQMLSRVQSIHDKFLIYRDIKPDNFLIGLPGSKNANLVHIVDFGMAKHYRDPKTKIHIPYRERKSLSGTARYMSINTHCGREQSRRDDLESLGHVFLYFLRGSLPWQGLKAATNRQKYERIGEKKQSTPIAELCEGFPEEFAIYMNYVRKLGFEENPDYDFLRELFMKALKGAGEEDDGVYDWTLLNGGKGWEASVPQTSSSGQTGQRRERDRHRDRPAHQTLPPTTPNLNARTPATNTPGDTPPPLVLSPQPAVLPHSRRDRDRDRDRDRERERERERERRRAEAPAAVTANGVGASPVPARRSSGNHLPAAHPYAATAAFHSSQAPSAYRPAPSAGAADAFMFNSNSRSRDASNVALVGLSTQPSSQANMRRAMTPTMGNGHMDMGRQVSMDRRMQHQGDMDPDEQRGGLFSVCCR